MNIYGNNEYIEVKKAEFCCMFPQACLERNYYKNIKI